MPDSTESSDGVITKPSSMSVAQTIDGLRRLMADKGFTVFNDIDHSAGATEAGLSLRPTELLVFGNPKGGTPLMQSVQTIGIDLPLKALVWQDEKGTTWLSYNDPEWLARRHGAGQETDTGVRTIAAALGAVAATATSSLATK